MGVWGWGMGPTREEAGGNRRTEGIKKVTGTEGSDEC